MDKQTLSNYGWIIILVLILAVLLALASPFGLFVSDAIKGVTGGFWDVNSAALNVAGIDAGDVGFPAECGIKGHYQGDGKEHEVAVTECNSGHTYTCECDCWVVPDGGKYYVGVTSTTVGDYTGATKVYNAGEKLPCGYVPVDGDTFVLGDYEYRYGATPNVSGAIYSWLNDSEQDGWGVRVLDRTKSTYGEILPSISNVPITSLNNTFCLCSDLTSSPIIPDSVTEMNNTFQYCHKLTIAPKIPSGVTDMYMSFESCYKLTTPPEISKETNLISMEYAFSNCISLTTAPIIPDSVTNMRYTFFKCKSLITASAIPKNVTDMYKAFSDCKSLTIPPDMSNATSVTNMESTFSDCTSLATAPIIPSSVTNLSYTFSRCSSLTTVQTIPSNVTKMKYTFQNCISLTGGIEISTNISYDYDGCFNSVDFTSQNLTFTGESSTLDRIGATGKNYCSTCNGKCLNNH